MGSTKLLSAEDQACEAYVKRTISRKADGKLMVRLPFNSDPKSPDFLGDSFNNAERRFLQLKRRFERNPKMKEEYIKCNTEYISLGHAIEVPQINELTLVQSSWKKFGQSYFDGDYIELR